ASPTEWRRVPLLYRDPAAAGPVARRPPAADRGVRLLRLVFRARRRVGSVPRSRFQRGRVPRTDEGRLSAPLVRVRARPSIGRRAAPLRARRSAGTPRRPAAAAEGATPPVGGARSRPRPAGST